MPDLRRLVIESSRRHGLGGVAVGVVHRDERPVVECVGLADRLSGRRVDPDTVFRIASISKTLTAIAVMRLRDERLFALDEPVNNYLKSIRVESPRGTPEVTFRHLLTHTAGIGELPRVSDLWRREAWGGGRPFATPSDLAELYGGTLRTEVAAGSKWAYANHGFAVLGQLVQDISGRPFAEYMREHILEPLGMRQSDYLRTERVSQTLATGYHWIFGRFRAIKDYDLTLLGPGAVLSPLADMIQYATWLAHATHGTEVRWSHLRP
jgi:CubicO group peptidase (beta-lactamase class C family)